MWGPAYWVILTVVSWRLSNFKFKKWTCNFVKKAKHWNRRHPIGLCQGLRHSAPPTPSPETSPSLPQSLSSTLQWIRTFFRTGLNKSWWWGNTEQSQPVHVVTGVPQSSVHGPTFSLPIYRWLEPLKSMQSSRRDQKIKIEEGGGAGSSHLPRRDHE